MPVTVAIRSAEVAGPGAGFNTCKSRLPGSVKSTVAVNCVPLLKVVVTGEPLASTCAPVMNFWPESTMVAGPGLNDMGVAAVRIGMGFITAMFCTMETAGIIDAGDGELDDIAWSRNNRRSGISDEAVVGHRGSHRGIASGNAVDLKRDAGVIGSIDG